MTLNLNPLETNLVNLVIVIGLLFWFLRGFLGGILERRRAAILQELQGRRVPPEDRHRKSEPGPVRVGCCPAESREDSC